MKLTKLVPTDGTAGECSDGKQCPAVFDTDTDVVVVQGRIIPGTPLGVPIEEALVAVPRALLRSLAGQLAQL